MLDFSSLVYFGPTGKQRLKPAAATTRDDDFASDSCNDEVSSAVPVQQNQQADTSDQLKLMDLLVNPLRTNLPFGKLL